MFRRSLIGRDRALWTKNHSPSPARLSSRAACLHQPPPMHQANHWRTPLRRHTALRETTTRPDVAGRYRCTLSPSLRGRARGRPGARTQRWQEIRAVESAGAPRAGGNGEPRRVRVGTVHGAGHQARHPLPVRRPARPAARAGAERPPGPLTGAARPLARQFACCSEQEVRCVPIVDVEVWETDRAPAVAGEVDPNATVVRTRTGAYHVGVTRTQTDENNQIFTISEVPNFVIPTVLEEALLQSSGDR